VNKFSDHIALAATLFCLSLREAWRNKMGMILFFGIPVIFLSAVQLTAGGGIIAVKLYYPEETLQVLLTIRHAVMVFAAAAVCGFLSAYYALILFHQDFDYFRFCVFNGLHPAVYLAGRFGFFLILLLFLAAGMTLLTGALVTINHPWNVFVGFLLMGVIYGACGGLAGMMTREFLAAFLFVALLADIDAGWLQNPVYYSAGQNIEIIRWLPAFYPCQMIFAAGFTEDPNPAAAPGSLVYATVVLCMLLTVIVMRLKRVRHSNRSPAPGMQLDLKKIPRGEMP
jgi:hypothetical protein